MSLSHSKSVSRCGRPLYNFFTIMFRFDQLVNHNRPRSIYRYSSMAPRPSGQTSIFGVAFFVFKSLLGIEVQDKL